MRYKLRKAIESVIEKILLLSGGVTSIVVLLIVLFLFKEGFGLFNSPDISEGYSIVLNKENTVKDLNPTQLKDIFDYEYTSWNELGGSDEPVIVFHLSEIEDYCTIEEMGEELENIPQCINKIVSENPGIIAYVPTDFLPENVDGYLLPEKDITFKSFFDGKEWYPTASPAPQFGVMPLVTGTLWVSLWAIIFSLPFGLAVAIYLAELSNNKIRKTLKPIIELLSGIPSVVYGFFGLVVVVPLIQDVFDLPVGETGMAGSIILAIMALPTIITVAEDAIRTTPRSVKEASLALGASHWQTIYRVIIPYSASGITAAAVLGIGRAIGETMAVLMVTGNAAVIPTTLLEPMRTIPATIAAELGEAPAGGAHYKALFMLGAILFLITLVISITVEIISSKKQRVS
ncbi:MAG: phosphate ABC transporter permease subunit PstC [Rikenellaceae bacterium]